MKCRPKTRRPRAVAHGRFRVFGYEFAFGSNAARATELVQGLYGAFQAEHLGPTAPMFELIKCQGRSQARWELRLDGLQIAAAPKLAAALDRLEREICPRVISGNRDLIAIHGATVLSPRGALFLTGASGAGKSTLSLALAARGYTVAGDDVAFLDPRDGTLCALPRFFHLDARSRRLLRGVGLSLPERGVRSRCIAPADLATFSLTPTKVILWGFLGGHCDRTCRVLPLTQGEIIARLLSETPLGDRSLNELVALLVPLVTAARSYQIEGGRLADRAAIVARLHEDALPTP
jgi:hypothetical protein